MSLNVSYYFQRRLRTLVVVTNAERTLTAQALGPEPANLDIGLWNARVREQQPGTEDGLSEDVEDGVRDDLLVNVHVAGAVSDTPDTKHLLAYDCSVSAITMLTLGRRSR